MHNLTVLIVLTILLLMPHPGHGDEDHQAEGHEKSGHGQHQEHGADKPGHDDEGDEHDEHENALARLTEDQLAVFGIKIETAGPGRIDRGIELLGEVRPNGDAVAHIVPRFPGIALSVFKSIGDDVTAGTVLATVQSNESLAPYELKTQIGGTIIEKHLTRGEAVERDRPVYVVADLSNVWVDFSIYQKDIHEVAVGQPVRVSCHGLPDTDGVISYIAPIVDEPTRTAIARVVLSNASRSWRPGLFVTGRVLEALDVPLAIPRAAIQSLDDRSVVFVKTDHGFVPHPVILGRGGESFVEILGGMTVGERYAATNSFLLKAELGKGTAEHEH